MPKKFSAKSLDALTAKLPAARVEIADADGRGLYLIGGPRDGWRWSMRFRWPPNRSGVQAKLALGPYGMGAGLLSLKQAREAAAAAQADIVRGIDPRISDRQRRGDDRLAENVIDAFVREHVLKRNRPLTAKETKRFLNLYAKPVWRGRLIGDIRRADVAALVRTVAVDKPASAVKLRANLSRFFRWAAEQALIEMSPFTNIAVPAPATKRDRVLNRSELHLLITATDQLPVPFAGLVQTLLYTGQRRSEVAAMRWAEINMDARLWTVPAERSKNKLPHIVPLSPAMMALLDRQKAWQAASFAGSCPFVFSSDGFNPVTGFSYIKGEIDEAMLDIANKEGVAPASRWRLHDIRRSAVTGMNEIGTPPWIVEAVINHISGQAKAGVGGVYNLAAWLPERREALDRWAAHLATIAAEAPGKVVRLRA